MVSLDIFSFDNDDFSGSVGGALSGSKASGFGIWYWGYSAWLMWRRNNASLVSLHKSILWVQGAAFLVAFSVLMISRESGSRYIEYSFLEVLLIAAFSMSITYGLYKYFSWCSIYVVTAAEQVLGGAAMPLATKLAVKNGSVESTFKSQTVQHSISPTFHSKFQGSEVDKDLWARVLDEYDGIGRQKGLWAYLYSKHGGEESKIKAEYLATRVSEIEDRGSANAYVSPEKMRSSAKIEDFPRLSDIRQGLVKRWPAGELDLRQAAAAGSPDAVFDFGQALFFGFLGVKENQDEGYEFIRKAAESGDGDAAYRLAQITEIFFHQTTVAYFWALVAEYRRVPGAIKMIADYSGMLSDGDIKETNKKFNHWVIATERKRNTFG